MLDWPHAVKPGGGPVAATACSSNAHTVTAPIIG
jgi:hypothetical protein